MTGRDATLLRTAVAAGVQEGLAPLVTELQALRAALQTVPVPGEPDACVPCDHPVEARITFGGMGGPEEWECAPSRGGCGYRHQGVTT